MKMLSLGVEAVERGLVPDRVTRLAIRRLCRARLREAAPTENGSSAGAAFWQSLHSGPIAPVPEVANQQHYELPAEFFGLVLGPHRKYSCCFWPTASATLETAERTALELTCAQAQLADDQDILELGCGWGSLSLWMAERYPTSRITAVSNSASQRHYIEAQARARGLSNLRVVTADMNWFAPTDQQQRPMQFDRVVSVEMFEHMRNYELLLSRIHGWLRPGGELFVHVFCHRQLAYPFETRTDADWMARYFFTGGLMPSADLLPRLGHRFELIKQWSWEGGHYQRTAEAWLRNLDTWRNELAPILRATYGDDAQRWLQRWRMFFLAVAELFGFAHGREWHVAQYLMRRPLSAAAEEIPCQLN